MGGAAPNRLQRRDARILKYEMGLNMMRSSHYPPDPEFLDECDRVGLLVMDEFPCWQFISKSPAWQDNAVQAARDMILRDRNHPSIIVWGVRGNEASPREEDDRDLYTRTYALVRDLDPSRPPGGARLSESWHGKFVPEEVLTDQRLLGLGRCFSLAPAGHWKALAHHRIRQSETVPRVGRRRRRCWNLLFTG